MLESVRDIDFEYREWPTDAWPLVITSSYHPKQVMRIGQVIV